MRQKETNVVRIVMKIIIEGKIGRERSKKRWLDTIKNNMMAIGVWVRDVEN
jgi:hypothetical protein